MDKHDRPYRCPDPTCSKLQGFTYSGGLLRHEREVHRKHGGPKEQLHCPEATCKRHNGPGFTRKENFNEHMRRVHHKGQGWTTTIKPDDDAEVDSPTAFSEVSDVVGPSIKAVSCAAGKRKRVELVESPAERHSDSETDREELRGEIKRLKTENGSLLERMQMMEEKMEKWIRRG